MIRLIHPVTGVGVWVADADVDKYLARGHKLTPASVEKSEKPAKKTPTTTKRTTKK